MSYLWEDVGGKEMNLHEIVPHLSVSLWVMVGMAMVILLGFEFFIRDILKLETELRAFHRDIEAEVTPEQAERLKAVQEGFIHEQSLTAFLALSEGERWRKYHAHMVGEHDEDVGKEFDSECPDCIEELLEGV